MQDNKYPKKQDTRFTRNRSEDISNMLLMSKLTDKLVLEIREKYKPNGEYSSYRLASEYNVSRVLINKVVSKKIWNHI